MHASRECVESESTAKRTQERARVRSARKVTASQQHSTTTAVFMRTRSNRHNTTSTTQTHRHLALSLSCVVVSGVPSVRRLSSLPSCRAACFAAGPHSSLSLSLHVLDTFGFGVAVLVVHISRVCFDTFCVCVCVVTCRSAYGGRPSV